MNIKKIVNLFELLITYSCVLNVTLDKVGVFSEAFDIGILILKCATNLKDCLLNEKI